MCVARGCGPTEGPVKGEGEVEDEAVGEAATGAGAAAGGNCAARWQRAASSSTSGQRSCGGEPSGVYGMAPPLRSSTGGGTCWLDTQNDDFCVGPWRLRGPLGLCKSSWSLQRAGGHFN